MADGSAQPDSDWFSAPEQMNHRRYEALRAFFVDGATHAEIAERFGYSRWTVVDLVRKFRRGEVEMFADPKKPGPPRGLSPAKDRARERIVELRLRGLSSYQISARLAREGTPLSHTSVAEVLREIGLPQPTRSGSQDGRRDAGPETAVGSSDGRSASFCPHCGRSLHDGVDPDHAQESERPIDASAAGARQVADSLTTGGSTTDGTTTLATAVDIPAPASADHSGSGRPRLADLVYATIRTNIISGHYPMGSRLNEVHLAAELDTSRAPVREAIRRLSEEGLVRERPHQGAVVMEFDAESLVDLYNVRTSLERTTVRLVVKRKVDVSFLRGLIDEIAAAAASGDARQVAVSEFKFHEALCLAADNEPLTNLFRTLEGQILMALTLDDAEYSDLGDVAAEHEPILEAIEAGDEVGAADIIEEHIFSSIESVITRLGGDAETLVSSKI
ncbi:FCD domain-containing protein [Brevibacterium metallidurans]|uniref:HTH gntR-type domain-containing protein n=1 Tax=Brevibacterium metallidurans TaxID=1482676 RepID=A0ABP3CA22_9MICO